MAYSSQRTPLALETASPTPDNSLALKQLARAISLSQGQFSLILACCESSSLRQEIASQLLDLTGMALWELTVPRSANTLLATIEQSLQTPPEGLLVSGLESTLNLDTILRATNLARNEFARKFNFPLVLWVNESILQKLRRIAPDFRSWASNPIHFAVNPVPAVQATPLRSRAAAVETPVSPSRSWQQTALRFEKFQPPYFEPERAVRSTPDVTRDRLSSYTPFDSTDSELCILEPHSLEEMESVIEALRSRKSVVLKMTHFGREEGQRALDFLVGGTYALDGDQIKIAEALFVFVPSCTQISQSNS
ncbi:cell division protein SepF [Oscillatoria sp. FACHB-1406]|uniref:cell division protein SepF n=1 Tax=Oscillatoria sp. FACHB-1406 TaxID=2692846 RepID=UPI001681D974|nr:cell division protein SepF [Oscillatoria sp. FACHB-1406]MBD2580651.1 cell division protein SepF [Oscillatoria sp. FACHB-1406]